MSASPDDMAKALQKLIDCVSFDVNGVMGKGGNGGLTSTETVRAADEARVLLWRYAREQGK
ncbi:hypothetical protein [Ahrensia sp. R2A130]|uniref:hypothetical protein n=1 Tax=Ahrensia sp. R2A130 TaxID=744979 RepID=UPI0001E0BCAF|nr:hypothetical protein [Ahrensia sp. R2A130]EFL88311.1 conserved hypothetical protein [Ahrensia sp. R2A130]